MKNFNKYIETLPDKLDSKKVISLYQLIKKYCPVTISKINNKIYGKSYFSFRKKEPKWYTVIINYLIKEGILEEEKNNIGSFQNVSEDFQKYFLVPKSTVFSLDNKYKHLLLYKQTGKKFLTESDILDENGNERVKKIQEKKDEHFFNLSKKQKKIAMIFSGSILFYTLLQFIIMISKFGFSNMLPFFTNGILFTIAILVITAK